MVDAYIYNKKSDKMYIIVYTLGEGVSGTVYYTIVLNNFMKNLNNNKSAFNICCKALKIFNDDSTKAYDTEILIMQCVIDKKCENILYVDDAYKDESIAYVVFDIMDTSMEHIFTLFKYKIPSDIKNNIIKQMKNSLEYLHKCNKIHCDVKPENFLLCGLNTIQQSLLKHAKEYKTIIKKSTYEQQIKKFHKYLITYFEKNNNDDESVSDSDSDNNTLSECDTDDNTFISYNGEFEEPYDKFCRDYITKMMYEHIESESESESDNVEHEYYANKLRGDICIKLCDFGLMRDANKFRTCTTRCYRCPRNILGYGISFGDDLWALDMICKELNSGGLIHASVRDDENYGIYNNNLINIKMYYEKETDITKKKELYDLIVKSNRKGSILCSDGSFLFYKRLTCD